MKLFYYLLFLFFSFSYSQTPGLIFEYDEAGNQILREYITGSQTSKSVIGVQSMTSQQGIAVYPNPVETELTIGWTSSAGSLITRIELVAYNGSSIEDVPFSSGSNQAILNMSYRIPGVYYLKIYCSDGRVFTHSVIKN